MTTDTKPKLAYEEIIVGDELIKISGIAKGSGMIAPNLATMLSFIFTNADINSNLLKTLLKRAVANSFNAITEDSDQSTNDMVSIFSTRDLKIGQNLSFNDKSRDFCSDNMSYRHIMSSITNEMLCYVNEFLHCRLIGSCMR